VLDCCTGPKEHPGAPVGPEQLQALIDHTNAVIYMRDLDGRYMVVNREYERLFHLRREEIVELADHDLFPAEIADEFRANDLRAASGGPVHVEEVAPGADGPWCSASSSARPKCWGCTGCSSTSRHPSGNEGAEHDAGPRADHR
jgi:PAS domain S-box-containing protein